MSEQPTRATPATTDRRPGPVSDVTDTADHARGVRSEAPASPQEGRSGADPVTPPSNATATDGVVEPGAVVAGRYRLEAPLASGGMATVWRAIDEVLVRPVAIKVLHARLAADPSFVARFRREAVAAARLAHPSIVSIYDTCDQPEAIVMELVEGRTLRDELDNRRFLPPTEAVEIASGIAQALEIAHRGGLVHRDVKPANVLLSSDGRLKVADFGIAKAARPDDDPDLPDLTTIGHMVGTAKYLAPEQVSGGEIDARTDVYALGAVLYEMLVGRPPFQGDNDLATATARLHALPDRPRAVLPNVPPHLDAIVMRALATDPDDRYDSAAAFWAALQAAPVQHVDGTVAVARPHHVESAEVEAPPSFARAERSWLVPAALVSVVALALGLAWVLIGGSEAGKGFVDFVDRVRPGGPPPAEAVDLTDRATAFDPIGGDGERNDEAYRAVDGDPNTAWSTESYYSRELGGLKDGVGIYVDLGASRELDELTLLTPGTGWNAEVYVADTATADLPSWGEPVATVEGGQPGETVLEVGDARGSYLLLWITDLGEGPEFEYVLQELGVTAR